MPPGRQPHTIHKGTSHRLVTAAHPGRLVMFVEDFITSKDHAPWEFGDTMMYTEWPPKEKQ